jgi:endonuclease YncB( thermonuclease family)
VARVVDGRTLELKPYGSEGDRGESIRVRLLGVDAAAESDASCVAWLREACADRTLHLSFPPRPRLDAQGRWGAFVYLDRGALLNEAALEAGRARREPLRFDAELDAWMLRLENRARHGERGVWSLAAPG